MRRTRIWRTAGALFVAAAAAAVLWGTAAQASRAPAATHPVKTQPAKKQPGAITVHGRWVITVRNRHGKVVRRRRFENSLTESGAQTIVDKLTGTTVSANNWSVVVAYSGSGTAADGTSITSHGTMISTPGCADSCLTVTDEDATAGGPAIVLQAAPASPSLCCGIAAATLTSVETRLSGGSLGSAFTSKELSPAVDVVAGQSVAITVTITFS